jgi:hypothetical protein
MKQSNNTQKNNFKACCIAVDIILKQYRSGEYDQLINEMRIKNKQK